MTNHRENDRRGKGPPRTLIEICRVNVDAAAALRRIGDSWSNWSSRDRAAGGEYHVFAPDLPVYQHRRALPY